MFVIKYVVIIVLWVSGLTASVQAQPMDAIDSLRRELEGIRILDPKNAIVLADKIAPDSRIGMMAEEVRMRRNLYIGITGFLLLMAVILLAWDVWSWDRQREREFLEKKVRMHTRDLDVWMRSLERDAAVRKEWEERLANRLRDGLGKLEGLCVVLENAAEKVIRHLR